jgi:rare lipoprotein A
MKIYAVVALALMSCQPSFAECGVASFYSGGSRTATGERYHPEKISAAHNSLPFDTRVIVHDLQTGRSILVIINDRGPVVADRIIDLSVGAKNALGMKDGIAYVCIDVVSYGSGHRSFKLLEAEPEREPVRVHHVRHIQKHHKRNRRYASN